MSELPLHIFLSLAFIYAAWFIRKIFRPRSQHSLRSVAILVLGDIGRSPRMMYHAQSFAENGFVTHLIGYGGSKPIPSLERLPKVQICHIPELPKIFQHLPFLVAAPIKILHQVINILLCLLVSIDIPPEFILVQNPPSIPTLALVQLVCRIRGSKLIIDWHNLGYTILAMKLGKEHKLVRIARLFEATFGQSAYAHLFVTQAMRDFLVKEWDLQGHKVVLYDRPPQHFHRSSAQEIHELFSKLHSTLVLEKRLHEFLPGASPPFSTTMTQTDTKGSKTTFAIPEYNYSEVKMPMSRTDRPALLVSSTSWTPDEDFGILLQALQVYDSRAQSLFSENHMKAEGTEGRLPKLLVILTGKGPLKNKYMNEVGELQKTWKWVRCVSLWLEAEDYPILLGSADLGVCLHSSSSGLDLPMKVVDMFGCGLPVCALDFLCLHELVKDGKNGLVFQSASQLASQLEQLFLSFPKTSYLTHLATSLGGIPEGTMSPSNPHAPKQYPKTLDESENESESWIWSTWEENWGQVVRPLILSDVNL